MGLHGGLGTFDAVVEVVVELPKSSVSHLCTLVVSSRHEVMRGNTYHMNVRKGSHDHRAHWNVGFLALDNGVAMGFADVGTIPLCRPIPIPGYRLDEA